MNYWSSLVTGKSPYLKPIVAGLAEQNANPYTGLSDLVTPLNNFLKKMRTEGAIVAAAMYNSTGTVTHHNTDI